MSNISLKDRYKIRYPFSRDVFYETKIDDVGDHSYSPALTWTPKPYTKHNSPFSDDVEYFCDAEGLCIFNVISTHKPEGFPTRVFYTRKFITPDGNEFGKNRLIISTIGIFKRYASGYLHPYKIFDRGEEAAWNRYKLEFPL